MTVDREMLATRVARIREELRHLDRLLRVPLEQFLGSAIEQHATERELQIVIEVCLDIGHHVITHEGLRRPGDYHEVFAILREAGIVETGLGAKLEELASFRNRLVHGDLQVDPARVYAMAREEMRDVEAFVAAIVRCYGAV